MRPLTSAAGEQVWVSTADGDTLRHGVRLRPGQSAPARRRYFERERDGQLATGLGSIPAADSYTISAVLAAQRCRS